MLSPEVEDYLKAIYELQTEKGPPVKTSTIAEYCGVTPPTVSSMMQRLEENGFLSREKYKGVELTEEGQTVALEVIRHHRLIETYLVEHLGYEWDEVHEEADRLEHHISESFEERVADVLENPSVDPHGDPIPTAELEPPEDTSEPLSAFEVGDTVVVTRIRQRDDETLGYLADNGVVPGQELVLEDVTPLGVYVLSHGDDQTHLPETLAERVWVHPPDADADADRTEVADA